MSTGTNCCYCWAYRSTPQASGTPGIPPHTATNNSQCLPEAPPPAAHSSEAPPPAAHSREAPPPAAVEQELAQMIASDFKPFSTKEEK